MKQHHLKVKKEKLAKPQQSSNEQQLAEKPSEFVTVYFALVESPKPLECVVSYVGVFGGYGPINETVGELATEKINKFLRNQPLPEKKMMLRKDISEKLFYMYIQDHSFNRQIYALVGEDFVVRGQPHKESDNFLQRADVSAVLVVAAPKRYIS